MRCRHGILPVPVPAVVNIVQEWGLALRLTETEGEMITPTGAAIAAALCEYGGKMPEGKPQGKLLRMGAGAGKKDFPHANVLRMMLFEEKTNTDRETGQETAWEAAGDGDLWMLETNIDDCTGEMLRYVS